MIILYYLNFSSILIMRLRDIVLATLVNGSPPGDLGIRIVSMNTNPIRNSSRPFYSPYVVLSFANRKLLDSYSS